MGQSKSRISNIRSETFSDMPSHEIKKRKSLFLKAKNGSKPALQTLRKEYGITAIWDGHRLIR